MTKLGEFIMFNQTTRDSVRIKEVVRLQSERGAAPRSPFPYLLGGFLQNGHARASSE